ncbi:MAG: response regulator [Candidatus Saccharibacteria bacterium]|nr:response regulator [Candidatus Saccharibacteria bacterium]
MMKKIVIVEDDLAISQMYRMKFESDGFEVFLADNGKTGLELIEQIYPDIILLDLIMPEMSGGEMLAILRTKEAFLKTPVVILTNTESEKSEVEARMMGISAYIVKANETPTQVVAKVRDILNLAESNDKR